MYSLPLTCNDNLVLLCWYTMLATRGMLLYLSSGAMAVSVAVRNKAVPRAGLCSAAVKSAPSCPVVRNLLDAKEDL
jgi:hypothetical protein